MALPRPRHFADSPPVCGSAPLFPAGKDFGMFLFLSCGMSLDSSHQQDTLLTQTESIASVLAGDRDYILLARKKFN